jgi:hypothetical protein
MQLDLETIEPTINPLQVTALASGKTVIRVLLSRLTTKKITPKGLFLRETS